ncbi:hypothetical protein L209DRAFT_478382 [Thermothelomyces heterothallicus CBS 203.75]
MARRFLTALMAAVVEASATEAFALPPMQARNRLCISVKTIGLRGRLRRVLGSNGGLCRDWAGAKGGQDSGSVVFGTHAGWASRQRPHALELPEPELPVFWWVRPMGARFVRVASGFLSVSELAGLEAMLWECTAEDRSARS